MPRIARRIPVARVLDAAENPVGYVQAVATGLETTGWGVEFWHCEFDERTGHYAGWVELSVGMDVRWSDGPWFRGWRITRPNGRLVVVLYLDGLYPAAAEVVQAVATAIGPAR